MILPDEGTKTLFEIRVQLPELIEKIRICQEKIVKAQGEKIFRDEQRCEKDEKGSLRFVNRIWISNA